MVIRIGRTEKKKFRTSVSSVVKTTLQDIAEEHSRNEERMKTQRGEIHKALVASLQALATGSNPAPVDADVSAIEALKLLTGTSN